MRHVVVIGLQIHFIPSHQLSNSYSLFREDIPYIYIYIYLEFQYFFFMIVIVNR